MATKKTRYHLYIDASTRAAMERIAEEENRSLSNTIEMACRALIERRKRALADVGITLP